MSTRTQKNFFLFSLNYCYQLSGGVITQKKAKDDKGRRMTANDD